MPAKRKIERRLATWPGSVQVGSTLVIGRVRDVTPRGLFFEPTGGLSNGWVGEESPIFDIDEVAEIVIDTPSSRSFRGAIRWTGRSNEHDCVGFGVELLNPGL